MRNKGCWIALVPGLLLLVVAFYAAARAAASLIIGRPHSSLVEALAETGDPANYGLPAPEEISIDAGEVTLAGWYFENPLDGDCGVMFMHGYLGTRYHALYFAPLFWERGCDILAYDHRGHGESKVAFHTYGYYEKLDALVARDFFAEKSGLDPSRIGIGGVSYGAATALQLGPMVPEAPFILADSAYASLEGIVGHQARQMFGSAISLLLPATISVVERIGNFDFQAVSPETDIAQTQSPVLLIHSRTDGFTPYNNSEAIFANSNQDRTVLHINEWGSAHAADIVTDLDAYKAIFDAFLAEHAPDFGITPNS